MAVDRAYALAARPELEIAPGVLGLTGLPSYFWLASRPRSVVASATAGSLTVTAEARPVRYDWAFGDGSGRSTRGIGRPWTPRRHGSISHTYERTGTYDVGVTIVWAARWRIGSGSWRDLGTFTTSDSHDYRVRQVLTFLVRTPR